jgi:hypothetical protein
MYLILYTIKHGEYSYGDRFLLDSCDFADILPEILFDFENCTLAEYRAAVADLRLHNRHEIGERVLCDLRVAKVDEADEAVLTKYLSEYIPTTQPTLASFIPQDTR